MQWLAFGMTGSFIPLYVQELMDTPSLSQAAIWSGLAVAVSPLIAATMAPFWGTLADRKGIRSVAVFTLLTAAGLALFGALARSPHELLLQRLGVGFLSAYGLLVAPMASLSSPREHLVSTMGQLQTSRVASGAIGPALGGILLDLLGMRLVYIITAVFFLGGAIWIRFGYCADSKTTTIDPSRADPIQYRALFRSPVILLLGGLIMGAQFVPVSLNLMAPLYIEYLDGGIGSVGTTSGLVISLGSLAMALTSLGSGQIRTAQWRALAIGSSFVIGAIGCLALAATPTVFGFTTAFMMIGAASGLVITLALSVGGLRAPANIQGRVLSLLSASQVFSSGVAPLVSGGLGALDPRWVFMSSAILMGLLAILAWFKIVLLVDSLPISLHKCH